MNIQGFAPSLDFRTLESKRPAAKSEPSKAEPTVQSPFGKDSAKLPAVLTGIKSDISAIRGAESARETAEARTEEPTEDSTPERDEIEDLSSDYEPDGKCVEDDNDEQDDQTEEQRHKKGRHLEALEKRCYAQLLLLDRLTHQLIATQNFLARQIKDSPS
jgi:hypothetical protein